MGEQGIGGSGDQIDREIEGFEADAKVDQAQLLVRNKDYSGAIRLLKAAQAIRPRDSVQRYLDEIEAFQRNR